MLCFLSFYPVCTLINTDAFALFATVDQTSEPIIDDYSRRIQLPYVTVNDAFADVEHKYKIRMLPDVTTALRYILARNLKWKRAYYIYNSRKGKIIEVLERIIQFL